MRTMLIVVAVVCALALLWVVSSARADVVTPPLDLKPLALGHLQAEKRAAILPAGLEIGTFAGPAFPGMTGGGMISYMVATTPSGDAKFFVDLGLAIVEAKPLGAIAGMSWALPLGDIDTRAGIGPYILFAVPEDGSAQWGFAIYVRVPIISTVTF